MPESNEADIPVQQTEGASVVDLPVADADVTDLAATDTAEWSSDVAFLNDSGGLKEWRSFTASREPAIDATQDQLPKLTLSDDSRASAKTLDSRAIAQDAAVVDKSKLAAGAVPELEGGQSGSGEPPRITDPLPPFPPGIHITVPNPHTPGFSVMDPAVPAKPGVTGDASIPIKAGTPGEAAVPKPGDSSDPTSVPTEPPKITDPIPKGPPSIERIVDHGALTGRKSDTPGASIRHPNSRDTTPAGQAVTAFRATLKAAEAQNQALQNPKLAAQLAAQMELKKLAAQNPERALKETEAAALLARKALMRGDKGSEKNSGIKLGGRPKELGKRDPLQTPDGIAAKPSLDLENTDLASVLKHGFAASVLPEKGKHGIASSFPVDGTSLLGARAKELVAGVKLHDDKGTAGTGQLLEQAVAGKTHLPELTLFGKPHAIEPHAVKVSELNDSIISKPAKLNPLALDVTAPTLSEKSKIFIAAHTPVERSLLRHGTGSELAVAHTPIQRSLLRDGAAVEDVAAHTPVERSHQRHAAAIEHVAAHTPVERSHQRHATAAELAAAHAPVVRSLLRQSAGAEVAVAHTPIQRSLLKEGAAIEHVAAHTPVVRSLMRQAAGAEHIASNMPIARSLLRQAAGAEHIASNMPIARSLAGATGREFVAAAIPQDIKVTSRARHAIEPSNAIARLGEPIAINTSRLAARSLNFSPILDDRSKRLVAANSTEGKSFLRVASGEKVFVAGSEPPVRLLKAQPHHSIVANNEHPQSQEQLTVLQPIKRHTPNTYARTLSDEISAPLGVEKSGTSLKAASKKDMIATTHARDSIVSAHGQDSTALAIPASRKIMHAAEPLPVDDGDDTIKITSVRSLKQTDVTEKSLVIADSDETAPALTMSRSLLASANSHKSNMDTLAQVIRNADAAPERETVRKASTAEQKESGEKQVARTASVNEHGEIVPAKFAGEFKLRVTYLHIGNRVFLLERRLVENNSRAKEPAAPPSELIVSAGVAAVIAGRRLRRRKKKGEAQDNSSADINEFDAVEGTVPTTDSVQLNRESVLLTQAVTRFSYMIQPGDTLVDLAQAIWQDTEVAWLLAEVNKLTQEWQGSECSITLVERQVIELPLPEEVVDFYRSGVSTLHTKHKLTTIVTLSAFDEELAVVSPLVRSNSKMVPAIAVVNIQDGSVVNASTF